MASGNAFRTAMPMRTIHLDAMARRSGLHRSIQLKDAQIGREDTGWNGIEPGRMAVVAVATFLRIAIV